MRIPDDAVPQAKPRAAPTPAKHVLDALAEATSAIETDAVIRPMRIIPIGESASGESSVVVAPTSAPLASPPPPPPPIPVATGVIASTAGPVAPFRASPNEEAFLGPAPPGAVATRVPSAPPRARANDAPAFTAEDAAAAHAETAREVVDTALQRARLPRPGAPTPKLPGSASAVAPATSTPIPDARPPAAEALNRVDGTRLHDIAEGASPAAAIEDGTPTPIAAVAVSAPEEEIEEIEPERESDPGVEGVARAEAAERTDAIVQEEPLSAEPADGEEVAADEASARAAVEEDTVEEIEPEREEQSEQEEEAEDIPIDLEEEPLPKRPPLPPPRKQAAAAAEPGATKQAAPAAQPRAAEIAEEAVVLPPPPAAPSRQVAEPAPRRKQKPWWEELFGDDFIRTMDRLEPKQIRREVDFIEESLGVERGAVILDLACGTGQHAVELASRGYSVVGYDLSLAMLSRASDEAQERGQKLNFLQGDMREMAFEEMFDGVYCWSTSFGYFDDEKNVDVLMRIFRALRQGGMLLLDIANRDYVSPRSPSLVWFEGDGCVCMDEMHVDFFSSRLKVKRTSMFDDGRSRELDYSIRLYALHEVGKMLHECGFKVVEVTGHPAHPGVFFGSESPRIIILAERG